MPTPNNLNRVLIVDDEAPIAEGLMLLFEMEQIEAVTAVTREAAEELVRTDFFPVILADVRLRSEEEGLRLLESIRSLTPRSRVASLTGYRTPDGEARVRALGAEIVLYKPVDFDELLGVVREMLGAFTPEDVAEPINLDELYNQVRGLLHALPGRRYGLAPQEAEEIVQDAWCLFLQKQATIREPRAWLAGAVVNLCKQTIGENRRRRDRETEITPTLEAGGNQAYDAVLAVRQALARVDQRTRALCTLIGLENRSYEEVSASLGIPIGSIGPLYMRAKVKLKTAMYVN
jgi:RNA polymerase sigma factor (sigma-70 family)